MFKPVGKWGGANDDQLDVCGFREVMPNAAGLAEEARGYDLNTMPTTDLLKPNSACYAARPYNFIVGADGKLMKCTQVLDTMPDNVVGRLTEDGKMVLSDSRFAVWTRPYYNSDEMCTKCFFVPVCQGAHCPLPRVAGGERPCPEQKLQIQQTLNTVWDEQRGASSTKLVAGSAMMGAARRGRR